MFHAACSEGHVKVAVLLLRRGIDYKIRSPDGKTGLELARKFGKTNFVAKVKPLIRLMEKEANDKSEREARKKAYDAEDEG